MFFKVYFPISWCIGVGVFSYERFKTEIYWAYTRILMLQIKKLILQRSQVELILVKSARFKSSLIEISMP